MKRYRFGKRLAILLRTRFSEKSKNPKKYSKSDRKKNKKVENYT